MGFTLDGLVGQGTWTTFLTTCAEIAAEDTDHSDLS